MPLRLIFSTRRFDLHEFITDLDSVVPEGVPTIRDLGINPDSIERWACTALHLCVSACNSLVFLTLLSAVPACVPQTYHGQHRGGGGARARSAVRSFVMIIILIQAINMFLLFFFFFFLLASKVHSWGEAVDHKI
jgi:hypothetical protein